MAVWALLVAFWSLCTHDIKFGLLLNNPSQNLHGESEAEKVKTCALCVQCRHSCVPA